MDGVFLIRCTVQSFRQIRTVFSRLTVGADAHIGPYNWRAANFAARRNARTSCRAAAYTTCILAIQEASKINYALRCEQDETRLLALKVEPYNLLLLGEEACVPELLRFLFDGGYEIKNYLCASELGYVLMQKMQSYGRCYEEALAMDFMEARSITEPSAPEVETAREDDLDEIFDCAQRFVSDCGLLDKPEKEPFRKILDSFRIIRADGKIVSMARIAPATQDDLRLVLVYTRNEYRGKGYARKVVNSAKNEILTSGKRATLNVDRKNPVSYHLYLSLGFERMFSQGEFRRVE